MFKSNLFIILIAIGGAALGLFAGSHFTRPHVAGLPDGSTVLSPGGSLAELRLSDPAGKPHRIGDWQGKTVLINFWASWCEPCREEMPLLDAVSRQYADDGLSVIGVAVDDADAVAAMLKDRPVSYPILLGDDDTLQMAGDDKGVLPYSLLIGPDGSLMSMHLGSFPTAQRLADWIEPHLAKSG